MARKTKRQKAIKRLNLSDHTLDINIRKCNYNKFNFSEIEEYVRELVGSRDYQYDAIKQIMIYLRGGGYKTIADPGKAGKTGIGGVLILMITSQGLRVKERKIILEN
ncbi:MAG: hypothetical protein J7M30_06740 [Deltaproteobacteria bacterium]|nr:hypothetical protein [Deltaproteobacteria bacterium]